MSIDLVTVAIKKYMNKKTVAVRATITLIRCAESTKVKEATKY